MNKGTLEEISVVLWVGRDKYHTHIEWTLSEGSGEVVWRDSLENPQLYAESEKAPNLLYLDSSRNLQALKLDQIHAVGEDPPMYYR